MEMEMDSSALRTNMRRRLEDDVSYWRKRAGWFDDDKTMKDFNHGVYDTYYGIDDDRAGHSSSTGHTKKSGGGGNKRFGTALMVKAGVAVAVLVICYLIYRAVTRRGTIEKPNGVAGEGESTKHRSDSSKKSRSRSKSASRSRASRSRSRSRKASSNYELMDDEDEARSRKSTRSRSRRRRSRSRTDARSRSKSKGHASSNPSKENILV